VRKKQNETYEQWLLSAKDIELKRALSDLALGQDVNSILEQLSERLLKKILHPLIIELKNRSLDK